jgi:hypothetical protein
MKTHLLLTLLLVGTSLNLAAQGRDAGTRESFATNQEETELQNQLEIINGQLGAIQTEMKRRMDCQQNTRVSTATGCIDIPGLEGATLNKVNQQNAAAAAANAAAQTSSPPAANSYSAASAPPRMITVCDYVGEGSVEVCRSVNPDMIVPPSSSND